MKNDSAYEIFDEKKLDNKDNNNNTRHQGEQKQVQGFHRHHKQQQQQQQQRNPIPYYNVNLLCDPQTPKAGIFTKLTIHITEQQSGDTIQEFETIHDKLMHIIIVAEDLSYFAHIHPVFETSSRNFTINHAFPESGKYKVWIDFKPKDGSQTLVAFIFHVTGNPKHDLIPLVNSKQYAKNINDEYLVSLKLPKEIRAKEDTDITFSISDVFGNPITDLEPLMGAGGHSVIISRNVREFLHVHPSVEVEPNWKGGPDVSFKSNFTNPGLYKVWGQFQHHGKTITAGFTLEVV